MTAYLAYASIITICAIIIGGVLLIFDNMLIEHRINKIAETTCDMIPRIGETTKRMSLDMIKEINKGLYDQWAKDEES